MKKILLIFSKTQVPLDNRPRALGLSYLVNFCTVIVAHVRGKNLQEHGSYRVEAKNYQAELCKLIVWIAAYKMSQGNAAYSLLSSAFLNRNADTDNVRSAPLLNRLEVYLLSVYFSRLVH